MPGREQDKNTNLSKRHNIFLYKFFIAVYNKFYHEFSGEYLWKFTKNPAFGGKHVKKFLDIEFALSFLLPLTGVACIFFSPYITTALPYLLGAAMIIGGGIRVVSEIVIIAHRAEHTFHLGANFVIMVMGILFVVRGGNSLMLIGVIWGLIGIWQSAVSFQRMANAIHRRERFLGSLLLGVFRLAIALMLLLEPEYTSISHHVILLGIDILADTARMPLRHLKKLLEEKRAARKEKKSAGAV